MGLESAIKADAMLFAHLEVKLRHAAPSVYITDTKGLVPEFMLSRDEAVLFERHYFDLCAANLRGINRDDVLVYLAGIYYRDELRKRMDPVGHLRVLCRLDDEGRAHGSQAADGQQVAVLVTADCLM